MKEKAQLEKTLEALRENSERQVSGRIKSLNAALSSTVLLLYFFTGMMALSLWQMSQRDVFAAPRSHRSFLAEDLPLV